MHQAIFSIISGRLWNCQEDMRHFESDSWKDWTSQGVYVGILARVPNHLSNTLISMCAINR